MLSLLFCFDENYNIQSTVTLYSVLENLDFKIKVFIIHKSESDISFLPNKIKNHKNIDEIVIKKFENDSINFYNLNDVHVSEATYYRLFLEDYIPEDVNFLLYLDGDVVCVNNLTEILNKEIKKLKNSNFIVSSVTEMGEESKEFIDSLGLSSYRYFNAGVMLINFSKWKNENVTKNLLETLNSIKGNITFWDQDVMNKYFDGNFAELSRNLNTKFTDNENKNKNIIKDIDNNEIKLVHFAGKFKPWQVRGIVYSSSIYFQDVYRKLYGNYTFIQFTYRQNALKQLFSYGFFSKYINSKYNLKLIFSIIKEIIFKRNFINER